MTAKNEKILTSPDGRCLLSVSTNATTYSVPESTDSIVFDAFWGAEKLKSLRIPDSIIQIPPFAFCRLNHLSEVSLPPTLENICTGAFLGCRALRSIELPSGLQLLGQEAFRTSGLRSIAIPEGVDMERGIFLDCFFLQEIDLPQSLEIIPEEFASCCLRLRRIELPAKCRFIDKGAFAGSGLREIFIPDSVDYIGRSAFAHCVHLRRVSLPEYTTLDDLAFAGCQKVRFDYRTTTK